MAIAKKTMKPKKSPTTSPITGAPDAAEAGVLYCEATGKKIRLKTFDPEALLQGDVRIFASNEIGQAHLSEEQKRGVILVHVKAIYVDEKQNTRRFSKKESDFLELVESIKVNGILQPLTVIRSLDKVPHSYKLVAGYRRWAAAKLIELTHVPIRVLPANINSKVVSLLENLQRENPSPMEVAKTVQAIINEGVDDPKTGEHRKLSQREAARILGMGQSRLNDLLHVAEGLHEDVQKAVMSGDLPVGKAAILAQLPPEKQIENLSKAHDMDNKALRSHVQDVRAELGNSSPKATSATKTRKAISSGVKYNLRPVGLLVDLLEGLWKQRTGGDKSSVLKGQIIALQFALSLITEIGVGMADIDAMRKAAAKKANSPAKKRGAKGGEDKPVKGENKSAKKVVKNLVKGKLTLPKPKRG